MWMSCTSHAKNKNVHKNRFIHKEVVAVGQEIDNRKAEAIQRQGVCQFCSCLLHFTSIDIVNECPATFITCGSLCLVRVSQMCSDIVKKVKLVEPTTSTSTNTLYPILHVSLCVCTRRLHAVFAVLVVFNVIFVSRFFILLPRQALIHRNHILLLRIAHE